MRRTDMGEGTTSTFDIRPQSDSTTKAVLASTSCHYPEKPDWYTDERDAH